MYARNSLRDFPDGFPPRGPLIQDLTTRDLKALHVGIYDNTLTAEHSPHQNQR